MKRFIFRLNSIGSHSALLNTACTIVELIIAELRSGEKPEKSAVITHYASIAMPEYLATIGESRMGRFGRAVSWRNMATFGTLDEMRHGQIQSYFPYTLLEQEPRADWAL